MINRLRKTLSCVLAAATVLSSFAAFPAAASDMAASGKEIVAGGYEIDMNDLPKVHFAEHPEWEETYNAAWEFHKGNIKKSPLPLNPEDVYYVDEAFDNTIFAWDTLFMMMFDKYGLHQFPTLQALDNFYYQQIDSDGPDDGHISRRITESDARNWYGYESTSALNPPLWAWAEWEQYQVHGDKERFNKVIKGKTVLERIMSHYEFIKRTRIMDNGLYGHTSGDGNGLDDTPNQDWGRREQTYNDLSIQQAQSAYYIAKIAEEIGDTENQQKYQKEYEDLSALINEKLWSEEGDFYFNLDKNQNFTNIATPTGLWAMSGLVATPERAQAMIDSYVLNSEKMFRPNGLSTVTYDYSTFNPLGYYWNGSVWSPTSYQFLKGLQAYGYDDLAFQSGIQHLNMLTNLYQQGAYDDNGTFRHTLWECYSSDYTAPAREHNREQIVRFNFVGWTGALAIGSTIEDVLGVTLSAPKNEVNWNLKLSEECGIDNLYMAGDRISLRADKRASADSGTTITVSATKPFTLNVTIDGVKNTFEVPAGETSYAVEGTENNPAYLGGIVSGFQQSGIDLAGSRDYVLFQNEDDNAVVDGLKKQFGKEDSSLYNINTIGFRNASVQKSSAMDGLVEGKELFEYVKTGERDGFMVMAKAGHDLKTMKLVLGVQNAKATVKASLSDASQQNFTKTITAGDEEHVVMVEIPFRAASDGKYLMAEYRIAQNQSGKTGKITLKGVILEDGGTEYPKPPAIPQNVTLASGNGQLTVSADAAEGQYDSFEVLCGTDPMGLTQTFETESLPYTITGLDNYQKYYVSVVGIKDGVPSDMSDIVNQVPEEEPKSDAERAAIDFEKTIDAILNGNESVKNVKTDLNFDVTGPIYGSQFEFVNYDVSRISETGAVIRPSLPELDKTIKLGVKVTYESAVVEKVLPITIKTIVPSKEPYAAGTVGAAPASANLTEEGAKDWAQFGSAALQSYARKDIPESFITDVTPLGVLANDIARDTTTNFVYTDGKGSAQSPSNNHTGYKANGVNNGFSFKLPASGRMQKLRVYAGSWASTVRLQLTINGETLYSDTFGKTETTSGALCNVFEVNYLTQNPDDDVQVKLYVEKSYSGNSGNLTIQAISLRETDEAPDVTDIYAPAKIMSRVDNVPAEADLTAIGTKDWVYFDTDNMDTIERKNVTEKSIGGIKLIGRSQGNAGDYTTNMVYSDGTKNAVSPATSRRARIANGLGSGFEFTLPYSEKEQQVKIYAGSWASRVQLTAYAGDQELACTTSSFEKSQTTSGALCRVFTINYKLDNPDDVLTVRMLVDKVYDDTWANMNLSAIALSEVNAAGEITSNDASIALDSEGYVNGVQENTTASTLLEKLSHTSENVDAALSIVDKDGNELEGDALVGTGCEAVLTAGGEVLQSGTVVIGGDVDGNGKIGVSDLLQVKAAILSSGLSDAAAFRAADMDGNGRLNVLDLLRIKLHILNA